MKILNFGKTFECKKTSRIIKFGTDKFTIPCDVYSFEDSDIPPFFGFCNKTICAFVNERSVATINYEDFSKPERTFAAIYVSYVINNGLVGEFDQFRFNGRQYVINWIDSPTFQYKFDSTSVTISCPKDSNRMYWITKILEDLNGKTIANEILSKANEMELLSRIEHIYFSDCYNYSFTTKIDKQYQDVPLEPGVFGTNYSTNYKARYIFDENISNIRCCLIFCPIILYMNVKERTMLITHELSHIRVGNAHMHDRFFWFTFEWFSGYTKHNDFAYHPDQEERDSLEYDQSHPIPNDKLIKKYFHEYKKFKKNKGF